MLAAEKLEIILEMPEQEQIIEGNPRTALRSKPVPKTKVKPRFYKLAAIGMICAIFASGLYFCSLVVEITAKGYELNKIKTEVKELAVANERIRLEIAKLDSLDRVEAFAVAELGMRKPLVSDYLLLADKINWNIDDGKIALSGAMETEKLEADGRPLFQQKAAALLAVVLERGKS